MKYIKLFERTTFGFFWEIRTDEPYFTLSLKKIGFPLTGDYSWAKNVKRYYVGDDKQMGRWYFGTRKTMMEHNLMFMGSVEITQYEIDADKYNL